MDRQTRKANFKKLQQPAATTKLRNTRSTSAATAPMTLSEYFNSQENTVASEEPKVEVESVEQDDPFAEPKTKKTRESQDIEPPTLSKPKKAPKLKSTASSRRGGATARRGRSKKQPSISDFLRNEQLFAEVTAQHCLADNFSPDDVEMALALSKSEAEKYGILRLHETEDERVEEEDVVNLLGDPANQSTENVRRKLQKYGFRTAAKEEYNLASIVTIPGASGKRGKRCKWANKFTALTLRNPLEQQKKVDTKIDALMNQQVRTKLPSPDELKATSFQVISSCLQPLEATARIIHEPSEGAIKDINAYYVEGLVEVSTTSAHHLLKNWSAIQGRDLSPKRPSAAALRRQQQLEQVYAELEMHFGNRRTEEDELDKLEKLVAENMIEENTAITVEQEIQVVDNIIEEDPPITEQIKVNNPLKEPPDKRARMSNNEKENLQPGTSSTLSVPTQSTRCASPDLFADSDEEEETVTPQSLVKLNISPQIYSETTSNEINCYEVYSSDEAKTVTETKIIEAKLEDSFIDLTQEQDSPEISMDTTIRTSLPDLPVCNLSPTIEFGEEFEPLDQTLSKKHIVQDDDCAISDVLYQKYAFKASRDNIQDEFFNQSVKSLPFTSFQNVSATASLSFTQSDSIQNTFQRSFNLTATSTDSLNLEHSFKSPLSRKSKSFTDIPNLICTSPFSHSNASIDLTQEDDDDNAEDNEGVLLSDDEINYSIWKADKTFHGKEDPLDNSNSSSSSDIECVSPLTKRKTMPYFKTLEDLDAYLDTPSPVVSTKSSESRSPNKSVLSKERAEFGILDAAPSQPFTLSQLPSLNIDNKADLSQVAINWEEASFLDSPTGVPLKRLSSSGNHRFKELLNIPNIESNDIDEDIDEFDLLVLEKKDSLDSVSKNTLPSGMDSLLTGEINLNTLSEPSLPTSSASDIPISTGPTPSAPDQLEVNGQVYKVRICHEPKPDFVLLSEADLMQHLYKYGIKPLKRHQAIKLLEFIYNQTHPIMMPLDEPKKTEQQQHLVRSKSTPVASSSKSSRPSAHLLHMASTECLTPTEGDPKTGYKFRDAPGAELMRFSQAMPPGLCDDFEFYVLQTNVTKKTPQPLMPLHIAWHNLLCANPHLHESVLMFEPIDLQEIYMYFKQMGYRYDPKELKCFFDRRCIIFRYELAPPTKPVQRHVRKQPRKKPSLKF